MKTPTYLSECPAELRQQLAFVLEIDRLKSVIRRSYLADESRHENSAEHSWHLAMIVLVLYGYASETIDLLKTLQLVLLHDVVEIDAGDAFVYDEDAQQRRAQLERAAVPVARRAGHDAVHRPGRHARRRGDRCGRARVAMASPR